MTLNSVFDSDSNKTITKKIHLKGLKLCLGKCMAEELIDIVSLNRMVVLLSS